VSIYGAGYGSLVDHLQELYVAHMLTNKTVSRMVSRSVGDVSVSYADKTTSDSHLYNTVYGVEFAQLISSFQTAAIANAV